MQGLIKRTVYLSCLGIDIYMLALFMTQSAMTTGGLFVIDLVPELTDYAGLLDGLIMIASVALGLILLWLFIHEMHDGEFLFHGRKPAAVILEKHRSFGLTRCLSFAALMFAIQVLSIIVLNITELILNSFGFTVAESPALNADYSSSILMLLYVLLIGPIAEELVFRGFLLKALAPCGRVYAIVVSALMFSLMHGDIQQVFFAFAAGLVFGYVATEYSIYASLILHIINNGLYGELLAYLAEHFPENVYAAVSCLLALVCIIVTVMMIIRNRGRLKAYIREYPNAQGAYAALKNRWFVAFAACMIAMTCSTVARMQY